VAGACPNRFREASAASLAVDCPRRALPEVAKQIVYRRLYDALTGNVEGRLSREERRAIVEIVRHTKPDVPAYWQ
jgi:hypothetical protein